MQAGKMIGAAVAEDQLSVKSEDSQCGRAKFLCSYGGKIMPRPYDGQLRYVGGETRILSVNRGISFAELLSKLKKICGSETVSVKYQLPDEDLDALVSVLAEDDLENMMEEYDRMESKDSTSRLRLFLFPSSKQANEGPLGAEHRFVEAVNGVLKKPEPVPQVNPLINLEKVAAGSPPVPAPAVVQQAAAAEVVPPVAAAVHVQATNWAPATLVPPPVATSPANPLLQPVLTPFVSPAPAAALAASPATQLFQAAQPSKAATAATQPAFQNVVTVPLPPGVFPTHANPFLRFAVPQVGVLPQGAMVLPSQGTTALPSAPAVLPSAPLVLPSAPAVLPSAPAVFPSAPAVLPSALPSAPAVLPSQQGSPAVVSQMLAPRPVTTKPPFMPLVDVSRGVLLKGVVPKQYSAGDDNQSDSVSSQGSSHIHHPDRRNSEEMNLALNAAELMEGNNAVESHLERYLTEQTMSEAVTAAAAVAAAAHPQGKYFVSDPTAVHWKMQEQQPGEPAVSAVQRVVSAPVLPPTPEVHKVLAAAKHLQRQLSEQQESASPSPGLNLRPAQQQQPMHAADIMRPGVDVLHNVVRQPQQPLQHPEPIKIVPQFVGLPNFQGA